MNTCALLVATPNLNRCANSLILALLCRYPYRRYDAITDDGYILSVDRIARPSTARAMLLVHGIMDSSHAWVAGGAASGLGFRCARTAACVAPSCSRAASSPPPPCYRYRIIATLIAAQGLRQGVRRVDGDAAWLWASPSRQQSSHAGPTVLELQSRRSRQPRRRLRCALAPFN